jgi:hypothetical protein
LESVHNLERKVGRGHKTVKSQKTAKK